MQQECPKFDTAQGHYKQVVLLKQIGLLFIFFLLVMGRPVDGQEGDFEVRGVRRYDLITQQPTGSVQGHPKLVALLVAEDYSPGTERPNWASRHLNPLPGVWQDLARMQRRLQQLGFGKIIVLAANQKPGSHRLVSVNALPGVTGEPAGAVTLEFAGPATRQAMLAQADVLRDHLYQNRNASDRNGGSVPPLFVFYYSGHGTIQTLGQRQVHVLPLSDNISGERTGALVGELTDRVGADSRDRGEAGNGSSLVVLDCCQAGMGLSQTGTKTGSADQGLLDANIMDAIRAGRQGRFLIGASLGDEVAREDSKGGYFTSAFCTALLPEITGPVYPKEELLNLNHVARTVDERLEKDGRQALSRHPAPGPQWDNFVLFRNPHFTEPQQHVRLWVETNPPMAQVEVRRASGFVPLETLGFVQEVMKNKRRRYEVPPDWVGRTLVLRAVPTGNANDRIRYEASPEKAINLVVDQEPLMAFLNLNEIGRAEDDSGESRSNQILHLMMRADKQVNALEQYRDLQAAHQLAQNQDGGTFTSLLNHQLDALRPKAGLVRLQQLIASAQALAAQHRYRTAYEKLGQIRANGAELRAFNLSSESVESDIQSARTEVLDTWNRWSVQQCREAAEHRLRQGGLYIENGQSYLAYQKAVEAKILTEQTTTNEDLARQATDQIVRAREQTVTDLWERRVTMETVVSREIYGLLLELSLGDHPMSYGLRNTLKTRYNLPLDSLKVRIEVAEEQFKEQYAQWIPPKTEVGEIFSDCAECPKMIVVPSGSFTMGSPDHEGGRDGDESPRHRVNISYWLAIGVSEVTFTEWAACVSAGGCGQYVPDDEGWGRGERPVINVSWDDAQSYVSWLSNLTGHKYSLLSESEWEYVARAGTQTARYWGESSADQCRYANGADRTAEWYNSNWTVAACDDGHYETSLVGNYEANNFGLYDVLGNVYEWTQDCYKGSYLEAPVDGSAWEPEGCTERVFRGGSWNYEPNKLRTANRGRDWPGSRSNYLGFRVARRF